MHRQIEIKEIGDPMGCTFYLYRHYVLLKGLKITIEVNEQAVFIT